MTRAELEHPSAPAEMCVSMEADVYPRNHPERADLIDGSIGELSPFHTTFGYYAQGVGPETATLPEGWQQRLIEVRNANTRGATGWCLEVHDLVLAKYVAGREKDRDYVRAAIRHGMLDRHELEQRASSLSIDEARRAQVLAEIAADFAS